jgi:hypothetical protein
MSTTRCACGSSGVRRAGLEADVMGGRGPHLHTWRSTPTLSGGDLSIERKRSDQRESRRGHHSSEVLAASLALEFFWVERRRGTHRHPHTFLAEVAKRPRRGTQRVRASRPRTPLVRRPGSVWALQAHVLEGDRIVRGDDVRLFATETWVRFNRPRGTKAAAGARVTRAS